jgi:hypothetical protein
MSHLCGGSFGGMPGGVEEVVAIQQDNLYFLPLITSHARHVVCDGM